MKIIIDTREQTPLEFPYEFVSEIIRAKLEVGDYACEFANGFRPAICFERKSISDLFGSLGKGYKRFKKEIEKAKGLDIRLIIIIEKPLTTVLKGYEKSDLSGESIIKKLFTLFVKHDIYVVFCKDRDECSRYIYETYCAIGRLIMKSKKILKENRVNNAELPTLRGEGNIPTIRPEGRGVS